MDDGGTLVLKFLAGYRMGGGMMELIVAIAAIVAMFKIADADGQTPWVWGLITFGLIVLCMLIPLLFIRIGVAGIAAFVLMIVKKAVRDT